MSDSAPVWLLDLRLDGRVYRWASEPAEVVDLAGDTHEYLHGLGDLSAAVGDVGSLFVHDPDVGWATHGPLLDGAPAVLRRWVPGTRLEDAEVYAEGEVVGAEWGAPDAPVSVTIGRLPGALGSSVPATTARVDPTTWPVSGGSEVGQVGGVYPVLLGYPGWGEEDDTVIPVVPSPTAEWSATDAVVILADDPDCALTSVTLSNGDRDTEDTYTTTATSDLLGQGVRSVSLTSGDAVYPTSPSATLYAGYSSTGGGGVVRDGYSVVRYLLQRWGGSVDWARLPEARDLLERVNVDTWIDAPMPDPWAWIESTLAADLPLTVRTGPRGQYLAPSPYTTDPRRTVGALVVGTDVVRASTYGREGPPANHLTFEGRRDTDGLARAVVVLTGDPQTVRAAPTSTAQRVHAVGSPACLVSVSRYGVRPAEPLLVDWTWDVGTLVQVAQYRADREALPPIVVSYTSSTEVPWREGDQIELTDDDAGWVGRLAIVAAEPVRGSTTSLVLRVPEVL